MPWLPAFSLAPAALKCFQGGKFLIFSPCKLEVKADFLIFVARKVVR